MRKGEESRGERERRPLQTWTGSEAVEYPGRATTTERFVAIGREFHWSVLIGRRLR